MLSANGGRSARVTRQISHLATLLAALALTLACAPAASAAGPNPLRGQWHLDDTCGTPPCNQSDSSGNNLTAVAHGNPTRVSDGRFNGALAFPAKSDYLDAGNQLLLQPPHVTLIAWVRN